MSSIFNSIASTFISAVAAISSIFGINTTPPLPPIGSALPIIQAIVAADLTDSKNNPSFLVVRFYAGEEPVSPYVAIPMGNVGRDSQGNLGVALYDQDSQDANYVARIVEPGQVASTSNDFGIDSSSTVNYANFGTAFGDSLDDGDMCFSADSTDSFVNIDSCDGTSVALSWPISASDQDDGNSTDVSLDEMKSLGFDVSAIATDTNSTSTEDGSADGIVGTVAPHTPITFAPNETQPIEYGSL